MVDEAIQTLRTGPFAFKARKLIQIHISDRMQNIVHSQSPNNVILKITVAIFPSRQRVFPSELLKLSWQSPLLANTRKYSSSRAGPIQVRIPPREYTDPYWAS